MRAPMGKPQKKTEKKVHKNPAGGKTEKPFEKKILHGQRSAARLLFPEEEMSESETAEVTEEWYETRD